MPDQKRKKKKRQNYKFRFKIPLSCTESGVCWLSLDFSTNPNIPQVSLTQEPGVCMISRKKYQARGISFPNQPSLIPHRTCPNERLPKRHLQRLAVRTPAAFRIPLRQGIRACPESSRAQRAQFEIDKISCTPHVKVYLCGLISQFHIPS